MIHTATAKPKARMDEYTTREAAHPPPEPVRYSGPTTFVIAIDIDPSGNAPDKATTPYAVIEATKMRTLSSDRLGMAAIVAAAAAAIAQMTDETRTCVTPGG
ncbi:hypothetical protein GCM10023152_28930 [Agromyces bauzanensis]|uniref:Uncharacterized protein n=1 Tax=Agromyces bauzanensis TaxID=1308924 RepID=A0A917PKQ6_9MICO|nr:hypothetical protein GCM10011372_20630 [Agromyces bauzanensis]